MAVLDALHILAAEPPQSEQMRLMTHSVTIKDPAKQLMALYNSGRKRRGRPPGRPKNKRREREAEGREQQK